MRVGSSENAGGAFSTISQPPRAASAAISGAPKSWSLVMSNGACPTARSGHSAVVAKESLYIFGGCGHPAVRPAPEDNDDPASRPDQNASGAVVAADAVGGHHADDAMPVCLGDLHVYDLARQSWSEVSSPITGGGLREAESVAPAERTCAAMCASQDEERLFLSGGAGDVPDDLRADLLEFDVRRRTWQLLFDGSVSSDSACRRIGHAMVHDAERNRLIVFGGSTGFEYFDDTHAFDLGNATWTRLATTGERPGPRYKHQAFIDADWMYIIGGGSFEPEGPDLDVFRLRLSDPAFLKWERVRPTGSPPRCRAAHGLAWDRVGRTAYIWGGFTSGMELDSTFCALRLPAPAVAGPADTMQQPTPPFPVPVTRQTNGGASSWIVSSSGAQGTATHGGVDRAGSVHSNRSSSYDSATRQPETTVAVTGARNKPGGAGSGGEPTTPLQAAAGGMASIRHLVEACQQQPQQQSLTNPSSAEEGGLNLHARGPQHGRERWHRRSQRLWRPTGEHGDTVQQQQQRQGRRSSRGGAGRRRTWGQGWATGRLQGLWGGATATSPVADHSSGTAAPSPSRSPPPLPSNALRGRGRRGGPPDFPLPPPQVLHREEPMVAAAQPTGKEEMAWVSLPSGSEVGDTDTAPSPAGRSFHCAFFHAGACYVTGGSDGARKFGDMWRFAARETPAPLISLAARAVVLAEQAAAAKRESEGRGLAFNADAGGIIGGERHVRVDDSDGSTAPHGKTMLECLPAELRTALEKLNMQAQVVL